MGIKLASVKDPVKVAAPLKVVERGTDKASALAVCERADGTLILTREGERDQKDAQGQTIPDPNKVGKVLRENYWKPTSALSDIGLAIETGLLA